MVERAGMTEPLRMCRGYFWAGEHLHSKECVIAAYTEVDLEKFRTDRQMKYGRQNLCKHCANEYWKQRRHNKAEHVEWLKAQPLRVCKGYLWMGERMHSDKCAVAAHRKADLTKFQEDKSRKHGRRNVCIQCVAERGRKRHKSVMKKQRAERIAWLKLNPQPLRTCRGYLWEGMRRYAPDCAKEAWTKIDLEKFKPNRRMKHGRFNLCAACFNEHQILLYYARLANDPNYAQKLRDEANRNQNIRRFKILERICDGEPYCQDPRCNWSGDGPCKDTRILCIDHIKGDGAKDRKKFTRSKFHQYLRSLPPNELRSNYQVLCHNHNRMKVVENNEHSGRPRKH